MRRCIANTARIPGTKPSPHLQHHIQYVKNQLSLLLTHHVVLEPWNHEFLSSPLAAFVGVDSRNHHVHIMPLLRAASPASRVHRSRLRLSGAVGTGVGTPRVPSSPSICLK